MAYEQQPRWQGIREYNDNADVVEYNNMIPLGDLCVDRLGCKLLDIEQPEMFRSRGEFVDSNGCVWFVKYSKENRGTLLYKYNPVTKSLLWKNLDVSAQTDTLVTFCEGTENERRIYVLIPGITRDELFTFPTETADSPIGEVIKIRPPGIQYTASLIAERRPDIDDISRISHISWYDRRLVMVDTNNNIVWLSATNFWKLLQRQSTNPDEPNYFPHWFNGYEPVYLHATPEQPNERPSGGWTDAIFPNFYVPINTTNIINAAVGYGGQLYVFGSHAIERWVKTGIEDDPVQLNTNSDVLVGGKSPLAINDLLYFIGSDQLNNQFAGMFTQDGSFKRISNSEIEKRFNGDIQHISLLLQRQETFCLFHKTSPFYAGNYAYAIGRQGYWWRWDNTDLKTNLIIDKPTSKLDTPEIPIRSLIGNIFITNKGRLGEFKENKRTGLQGEPITRYIREGYQKQLGGRKMVSQFNVTCDTGVFTGNLEQADDEMLNSLYVKFSFDRGRTFGRPVYRKLGIAGKNDKIMMWRNMGSGNNLVYEFGTDADTKFQVFDVGLILI